MTQPSLERLATPVAWSDESGCIQGINTAFGRWLGVSPRRIVGLPLASLEVETDALARFFAQSDRQILRLHGLAFGLPGHASQYAQGWLCRLDNGEGILEIHPIEELANLDSAQSLAPPLVQALRGFAHELRNPLAGLKGAAQLLARPNVQRRPQEQDLVLLICAEIDRLNRLLDRLFTPVITKAPQSLNIHSVLERILGLVEAEIDFPLHIIRDYDPNIPNILGDVDRLMQAFLNLVRNAIQAKAGQLIIRTRIEQGQHVGAGMDAMGVRVDVMDDGLGVPDEIKELIFLPFVSGHANGSGLGLAFVQQIAREHQGALEFHSRPKSTIFSLFLPKVQSHLLREPLCHAPV